MCPRKGTGGRWGREEEGEGEGRRRKEEEQGGGCLVFGIEEGSRRGAEADPFLC